MGTPDGAATNPQRAAAAAYTGPAGSFLFPRLSATTANDAASFGGMCAQALVGELTENGLTHNGFVHFNAKYAIVQFDFTGLCTGNIIRAYFWHYILSSFL